MHVLTIIGGGLAGCEAAWQAAQRGIKVVLYEMRPGVSTGAHTGDDLAELVCSNSLGSSLVDRASGLLQAELRFLNSLLIEIADATALPAGAALAVDRKNFSSIVTERICNHPRIEIIRQEIKTIPQGPAIIASGPLTSPSLAKSLVALLGSDLLYFFDAIAPIIQADSIDMKKAFRASRYERVPQESGDYINCPLGKEEYLKFVDTLKAAERINLREFEQEIEMGVRAGKSHYFEGCLPVEIMASRGMQALSYGPMRPVGLVNPHTGKKPYAVVQLRQDNLAGTLYNVVGFQTNLKIDEQKRVFHKIPGLEKAEIVRFGQMHRNMFIFSPSILKPTLQSKNRADLFFAGQVTGVEGYVGNIATGLLAGINASRILSGQPVIEMPQTTMIGALCHYITQADATDFQPIKAVFGILPPLENPSKLSKRMRCQAYSERALRDLKSITIK